MLGADYQQCAEREILRTRLRADIVVYREAILALEKDSQSEKAQAAAERTRRAYELARRRFNDHIAAHHCE